MKVLVTGAAGFIGFHLCGWLLRHGFAATGMDNLDDYYDVNLKLGRLEELGIPGDVAGSGRCQDSRRHAGFRFIHADLRDPKALNDIFEAGGFDYVCNLAAQAGVRQSLTDPHKYVQVNVAGFLNVLECCRLHGVRHLVYASSSSVYGLNPQVPFSVKDSTDHPISIYAATKKSNELMAHCYSHLYGLPTTGLRFFTVYGPWGRPDMALFTFTRSILEGRPLDLFNNGQMTRDFTYVEDCVEGIGRVLSRIPTPGNLAVGRALTPDASPAPFKLYNIGNSNPVGLLDFVRALEKELGKKATLRNLPLQPGDVPVTRADVRELEEDLGFKPRTEVSEGIRQFVRWYRSYYKV